MAGFRIGRKVQGKAKAKVRRPWAGTPAQWAALRKAQQVSAFNRKARAAMRNRGKAPSRKNRGIGKTGFKKNSTPYIRVNKRSQTIGVNAGSIISQNKRLVMGGYVRVENINKKGAIDRSLKKAGNIIAPRHTQRRKLKNYLKRNVSVTNPALRAKMGGAEVRLGTSRGAGPTVILRRGKHKVSQEASRKAIKRYDTHARKLNAKKQSKPRPQRRNKTK